jgi:hypothetical protein
MPSIITICEESKIPIIAKYAAGGILSYLTAKKLYDLYKRHKIKKYSKYTGERPKENEEYDMDDRETFNKLGAGIAYDETL